MFAKLDRLRMNQDLGTYDRRVMKETNNTNPPSAMRDEPHPTRHETEHPPIEKTAFKRLDPFKNPTKK